MRHITLGLIFVTAQVLCSASVAGQVYEFEERDEPGTEIGRSGSSIFVVAEAPGKCAGCYLQQSGGDLLPLDWVIVQDSTMGVVFTEPSGVYGKGDDYNGDVDLRAFRDIEAVEVLALTVDVWGDVGKLVSVTRIKREEAGSHWSYDPAWSDIGAPVHRHQASIMWVSRVMYSDRSIRETTFETIAAAWLAFTGREIKALPEPILGIIGE